MEESILHAVDAKGKDRLLDMLSRLVEVPTVNPPGEGYGRMVEVLRELLKDTGFDVRVMEVPRNILEEHIREYADHPRYIVVARAGSGSPVLHFNGHYDVVPEGQGWTRPAFKLTIDGDTVYGRGVVDMKGGLASMMMAAEAAVEVGLPGNGSLELSFTPDEETGGETGVAYMVESGIVNPDHVVVAEASGSKNVWIGNKGALWADVEIVGRQAHGSTPWFGANAFEGMVKVAGAISDDVGHLLGSRSSNYPFADPREAKPTMTIGGEVHGGAKVNMVPGYYRFSIDRRLLPEEKPEHVEEELERMISRASEGLSRMGLEARLRIVSSFEATVTSSDSVLVTELSQAIIRAVGERPSLTVCPGGLDTRYFQLHGVQAVTYGPGDSSHAHAADERNNVQEMLSVARAYGVLMARLLSS